MPVDTRHRDKNGEISRKQGNALIRTLRKTYGPGFAGGCADDAKLSDVLAKLDEISLSYLIRDHDMEFTYSCPNCGWDVEALIGSAAPDESDACQPVVCPNCQQCHSVNRANGEVLIADELGDPW